MTTLPAPAAMGLPVHELVLDIGCAGGRGTRELADLGYRPVGIELLAPLLAELRSAPETATLDACQGDATCLPVRSRAVRGVFVIEVLEHIPAIDEVLPEIARVLAPDGRACIAVPTGYTERIYNRLHPRYTANAEHVRVFTRASLTAAVERAGLRVERVETANLAPALAWLVHSILRTDADPTGRVLSHQWVDRASAGVVWGLRHIPVVRWLLRAIEKRVGKSWYFYCAPA